MVSDASTPPPRRELPLPPWLRVRPPSGENFERVKRRAADGVLHTVCREARCPNVADCWAAGTATFMVLGDTCTRGCRFCSVESARLPPPPDPREPRRLAETLGTMRLTHAVVTTVCRDDLPDQGAGHIAACVRAIRDRAPKLRLEVLIQDFRGDPAPLKTVVAAAPDILAHNLETVERLTRLVRDARAGYRQSLEALRSIRRMDPRIPTKSSLLLGLGETVEEIAQAMRDLREAGVEFLTLGQYLRPTAAPRHLPVAQYVRPERFEELGGRARAMGFCHVVSGPLVRSSYRAGDLPLGRHRAGNASGGGNV
ncbi:MAG: lipoyl synthase [Elusimicrobiota bacterium]